MLLKLLCMLYRSHSLRVGLCLCISSCLCVCLGLCLDLSLCISLRMGLCVSCLSLGLGILNCLHMLNKISLVEFCIHHGAISACLLSSCKQKQILGDDDHNVHYLYLLQQRQQLPTDYDVAAVQVVHVAVVEEGVDHLADVDASVRVYEYAYVEMQLQQRQQQ